MYACFNCGAEWDSSLRQPAVKETCEKCGTYLHCCKNCHFHRKGYPNECYIPDTEKVADKSRTNFCDEFAFVVQEVDGTERQAPDAAFARLFGEKSESQEDTQQVKDWLDASDKPERGFEELFGD